MTNVPTVRSAAPPELSINVVLPIVTEICDGSVTFEVNSGGTPCADEFVVAITKFAPFLD